MTTRFYTIPTLLFALLLNQGCSGSSKGASTTGSTNTPAPSSALAPTGPNTENGVAVQAATPSQCPYGGVVVESFIDLSHDGTLDPNDPILSTTPICDGSNGANGTNGTNGTNGAGAGLQIIEASISQCNAGGVQVTEFTDTNNNGVLDVGEKINSVNTICNGTSGANGQNGNGFSISQTSASGAQCPTGGVVYTLSELDASGNVSQNSTSSSVVCNGATGTGVVFTTVPATNLQCPTGGNVLLLASDTAGSGVYLGTDQDQQSVVTCNGAAGAQGAAGPVSAFAPMAPITPCGPQSSPWKEVLLCLADGNILADFSETASGQNTRLSFIPVGSYVDTDSSGCNFNVAGDGNGGSMVSWAAGSNSYAAWGAGSFDCPATVTD